MGRSLFSPLLMIVLLLLLPALGFAQDTIIPPDTATAAEEPVSWFWGLIQSVWPLLATLVASAITKGIEYASAWFRGLTTWPKRLVLLGVTFVTNLVTGALGIVGPEGSPETWTGAGALSLLQAIVAAVIFKFGRVRVTPTPAPEF